MKMRHLKTKVIGPVLLLMPMACMHLGGDHHSGYHYFLSQQPSYQYSTHAPIAGTIIGGSTAGRYDSVTAQEDPTTRPEGEKGG